MSKTILKIRTSFAANVKPTFVKRKIEQPFATGIIDPDWPYTVAPGRANLSEVKSDGRLSGFTRNRDGKNKYKAKKPLSIDALAALPIGDLIGGYLFMWTVTPFLLNGSAYKLLNAWGFEAMSMLTWAKYNLERYRKTGRSGGYGGVGFWFLGNAEFCIVAKKAGMPSIRTGYSSLIVAPKTGHSEKPDNIHELCESRFPGPYVEIFGRRRRKGWKVLGDEAPGGRIDLLIPRERHAKPLARTSLAEGKKLAHYRKMLPLKTCVVCLHQFIAKRSDARTCSPKCRVKLHRERNA